MQNKTPKEIKLPNKGVFTFTGDYEHWRQFTTTYPYTDLWYPVYYSESRKEFHISRAHAIEAPSGSGFDPTK